MENYVRPIYCRGTNTHLLIPMREDIPRMLRWMNDYEVTRFLAASTPFLEQNEEDWFKHMAANRMTDQVFVIGTNECVPIGTIGLHRIDWISRRATIGILIGEKEYWGKKHGTEAMMLILHYAFMRCGLQKIELDVHDFNERAQRSYLRCGFQREGVKRRHMFRDGKSNDTWMMGVLQEEWLPVWEEYQKAQA